MSSSKELVETALHVLVAWIDGRKPAPGDVAALRSAFPSATDLADDDLAVLVIHDLSGTTVPDGEQPPEFETRVKDVA